MKQRSECKHDWVKITNINKNTVWYCIFVYVNEYVKREKYTCLKCGMERI